MERRKPPKSQPKNNHRQRKKKLDVIFGFITKNNPE